MMKRMMRFTLAVAGMMAIAVNAPVAAGIGDQNADRHISQAFGSERAAVQVGPRPFYLVAGMDDGALKSEVDALGAEIAAGTVKVSDYLK